MRSVAAGPQNEIYLDIETLRLSDEVEGGWGSIHKFGLAVAVTWDPENRFRRWFEPDVTPLIAELQQWSRIITFNGDRFDLTVLQGYGPVGELRKRSLDLLTDLKSKLGYRIKLDSLARETLGRFKSGSGLDAVRWWRAGDKAKVCEYCGNDVQLLIDLVEHARKKGYVVVDGRRLPIHW